MSDPPHPPEQDLLSSVRALVRRRATGRLEVHLAGERRTIYFKNGDLFLAATSLPGRQIAAFLAGDEETPGATTREAASRFAAVALGWQAGKVRFDPTAGEPAEGLVGPLPGGVFLVAATSAEAPGESELLAQLGGERARWKAAADLRPEIPLDFRELQLLDALREARPLRELWGLVEGGRPAALLMLAALAAADLIEPAASGAETASATEQGGPSDAATLDRLAERVAMDLARRPLEMPLEQHRQEVADFLQRFAGLDHYELLGLAPGAEPGEVQQRYEAVARLVHPLHAAALDLGGREAALRLLLDRATEAYLVLSDPDRRRIYDLQAGVAARGPGESASPAQRAAERCKLAQHSFVRAMRYAEASEFHFAVELLRMAVSCDPSRSQYFRELARVQLRNPRWLRQAIDNLRRAVELAPRDIDSRLALAQACEKVGDLVGARVQYHTALRIAPQNAEAQAGIERLEGPRRRAGSLLERFFGRR